MQREELPGKIRGEGTCVAAGCPLTQANIESTYIGSNWRYRADAICALDSSSSSLSSSSNSNSNDSSSRESKQQQQQQQVRVVVFGGSMTKGEYLRGACLKEESRLQFDPSREKESRHDVLNNTKAYCH
jgi:hypothetical protein